jgi:hypothetical protein
LNPSWTIYPIDSKGERTSESITIKPSLINLDNRHYHVGMEIQSFKDWESKAVIKLERAMRDEGSGLGNYKDNVETCDSTILNAQGEIDMAKSQTIAGTTEGEIVKFEGLKDPRELASERKSGLRPGTQNNSDPSQEEELSTK